MSTPANDRAHFLRELLEVSDPSVEDFVATAVAGERLRRTLALQEDAPTSAQDALLSYETSALEWPHPSSAKLDEYLSEALSSLETAAEKRVDERDPEQLEDELWAVDEILCVAVALVRFGHEHADTLDRIATAALDWSTRKAPDLPVLWETADELERQLGPDVDYPNAYRWTEPLTASSRSTLALGERTGLRDPVVRRRIIENVYAKLTLSEPEVPVAWPDTGSVLRAMDEELIEWASIPQAAQVSQQPAFAAPEPGRPAGEALVVIVLANGQPAVVALRASYDAKQLLGNPFEKAPQLAAVSRDAIRNAFHAAVRLMPSRLPPAPFECHSFELADRDLPLDALDGNSLGLSAAIALFSAWTQQRAPGDVVATGFVSADGAVHRVGELSRKARGVAGLGKDRLLLSHKDATTLKEGSVSGLELLPAESLQQAIGAIGLTPDVPDEYKPWLGDVSEHIAALRTMNSHVRNQDVTDYAEPGSSSRGWLALADRMALILGSLAPEERELLANRGVVEEAAAMAALAYTHAGRWSEGEHILASVAPSSPLGRALRGISHLTGLIDALPEREQDVEEAAGELFAALEALPPHERPLLEGQVLGTIGRSLLHRHLVDEALPILQRALESHREHAPHEVARSRIYVAIAQRMAGAPETSLQSLLRARSELDTQTAPHSRAYAANTAIYLEYELARTLLELDRANETVTAARHALAMVERRGVLWPKPAILRTLVWALRSIGESPDGKLQELEGIVRECPDDALYARLLEEARRGAGDEVY